jgi:hypothetical protein
MNFKLLLDRKNLDSLNIHNNLNAIFAIDRFGFGWCKACFFSCKNALTYKTDSAAYASV